ncbi:tetratricopeptide repeat protein [Botrimarina sp.]|uniref:tetratricopeptide repeat protein n=1 Tax=Botrimarina sp. TaxID=2795802 RepID=UPI0032EC718A
MTVAGRAAVIFLALAGAAPAAAQASDSPPALVALLGHPAYAQRREAQQALEGLGLAAFDALYAGARDPDPEVAETSLRLLEEITADWTRAGDPPPVRYWLSQYEEATPSQRLGMLQRLSPYWIKRNVDTATPLQRGLLQSLNLVGRVRAAPALVRLARFEPSDVLAAEAVATLLASHEYQIDPPLLAAVRDATEDLRSRFGDGERLTAQWLALTLAEPSAETAANWRRHAERLLASTQLQQSDLSEEVVAMLHQQSLRVALRAADDDRALAAAEALASLRGEADPDDLALAIRWVGAAGRWSVADRLFQRHEETLRDKHGLYLRAETAALRGDQQRADELAAEALRAEWAAEEARADVAQMGPRYVIAKELAQRGLVEWAVAEYDAASGPADPLEGANVSARWGAHELLLDAGRYEEAAERLMPIVEHIGGSKAAWNEYAKLPEVDETAPAAPVLTARARYAAALAARERDDTESQIEILTEAIRADPGDADIVIAMHRVAGAPDDFAADTNRRIEELARQFENAIWENAGDSNPYGESAPYNQWAWLVSNTVGDYDKAVRYSRRSLSIAPDTAGYLDTLGRCLFAAGRLEEAIDAQRRAIQLEPHSGVMRRQLAEFEAALAARDGSEPATDNE